MTKAKREKAAKWLRDSAAVRCPDWCVGGHRTGDHPVDRRHFSRWEYQFRPVLMAPKIFRPRKDGSGLHDVSSWKLEVYVAQGWQQFEPRIEIMSDSGDKPIGEGIKLTLRDARKLRAALGKALEVAQSS
ncbi:hypothetical protein [Amycolatopsis sp. cg9]|uniref:DUF6907 domain-containing protein n=1 Tax=Amycolatopsis sp. cg9 TaxID=3238801 RepID=UPI0035233527